MLCGLTYVDQCFIEQPIQAIIDFWSSKIQLGREVDRAMAVDATSYVYKQYGLKPPKVRCWKSPIAMILAAETLSHGTKWVEHWYGKEIMQLTNEYVLWLKEFDGIVKSNKLSEKCICRHKFYSVKHLQSNCTVLRYEWLSKIKSETISLVHAGLMCYPPKSLFTTISFISEQALQGALEPTEVIYSRNTLQKSPRTLLAKGDVFLAYERCRDFMAQDITAYLSDRPVPDSCETAFRLLAQCCYMAILGEHECWLSDAPAMSIVGSDQEIDCMNGPAIRFNDGSELFAVNGFPVPESYIAHPEDMKLEDMPYTCSMRTAFLECYGVKRFLRNSEALCVAEDVEKRLWNLLPDRFDEFRSILEVDGSKVDCSEGTGIHYYESFKQVKTFVDFEESLDEHSSFIITNQLI